LIEDKKEEGETGAFNTALATLMRLDKLLTRYFEISSEFTNLGKVQFYKKVITKDLIIQSTPLIKSEQVNELMESVNHVKIKIQDPSNPVFIPIADEEVEKELDQIVILIQQYLQKEGKYLMPSKDESAMF